MRSMRQGRGVFCLAGLIFILLSGCGVARVDRLRELERVREELAARTEALELDPEKPLSLADCETLALAHNLEYRVRLLQARLQDDQVRLALAGGLPQAQASFTRTHRSNKPLVSMGGPAMQMETQDPERFDLQVILPLFDFGVTWFGYQIARDRRAQEHLTLVRARQLLLRDVRVTYAREAAAWREEQLWQTAVVAARELLRVQQSLEREGLGSAADTAAVEALLAQAAKELLAASHRIAESHLRLGQLLALPPAQSFKIRSELPALPAETTPDEQARLEERALKLRPELFVQDLERHVAGLSVRREIASFFPRLDGLLGFNWSNNPVQLHTAYLTSGFTVAETLLSGTSRVWKLNLARRMESVQEERALVLALGILYEVRLRGLRLRLQQDSLRAMDRATAAQEVLFKRILSRHREGLETGADVARSLAEVHAAFREQDRYRTECLVAGYELAAAALPEEEPAPAEGGGAAPEEAAAGVPPPDVENPAPGETGSAPAPGGDAQDTMEKKIP